MFESFFTPFWSLCNPTIVIPVNPSLYQASISQPIPSERVRVKSSCTIGTIWSHQYVKFSDGPRKRVRGALIASIETETVTILFPIRVRNHRSWRGRVYVSSASDENHPPNFCSIDWRVILTTTTIRSNVSVNVVAVSGKSCLGNGPWPVVFQSFIFVAVERQRWLNARRDHRRLDFARLYIDTSDNDQFGPRTSNDRSTESSG